MTAQARRTFDEGEIRATFKRLNPYPYGNGFSWDGFLKFQKGWKGLFMLVLERELSHQEIGFWPHREQLFGMYADRNDGKLGKACFGWATPDFGSKEKAYTEIFTVDGYDPKFLHTYDVSPEGQFLNSPAKQYKIVKVNPHEDDVACEIAKLARRFISSGVPTKEQAAVLAKIYCHLGGILQEWPNSEIRIAYIDVVTKIKERHALLNEENGTYAAKIKENQFEMDTLVFGSP